MPAGVGASDRLNGWKEIAAYLGKGVRTVQRWERDYGLPVHRLGRNGGEIIWATRRELDGWLLLKRGTALPEAGSIEVPAPVPPAPPATPVAAVRARRRWLPTAGVAVVSLLLVSWALRPWLARLFVRDVRPAAIDVRGRHLDVLNRSGSVLWGHDFEFNLRLEHPGDARPVPFGREWILTDLDGDGETELLLVAHGESAGPDMALYAFNHDGTERFRWQPGNRQVTFGAVRYSGPWIPYRIFADDEGGTVFAAFVHVNEFPTLLVELDTRGKVLAEYWSDGYIETVHRGIWKGRDALLVGASNNETKGASLAIFEGHPLRGSAPAENPKYRCANCASGGPLEFVVFPRRDGSVGDNAATVQDVKVEEDGTLHVQVSEGGRNPDGAFPASVWYTLGPQLSLERLQFTPGLAVEHEKWQKAGQVNHALGAVDEQDCLPVRRWDGTSFVDVVNHTAIVPRSPAMPAR